MQEQDSVVFTLENGIRVVHTEMRHSEVVHCGFMINVGSRDETPENNGVAHFIEHTVFKGTEKRKSHHILRRIENVGGELNAYTTREKTTYYASCLKQYAERAVELLADITFNSVFPEKEIEKEKKVILEEIDMYDDSPEESIYDDYYTHLFKGHPLGYNILGTKETVTALNREDLMRFIKHGYKGNNIVLSLAGGISASKAEKIARKIIGKMNIEPSGGPVRMGPAPVKDFRENVEKDFTQTHCIMGGRAYDRYDRRRYGLSLINNILGNTGMSSRLNMAVREKHGLTYHIGSHYSAYKDTGAFTIYFATDKKNLNKCMEIVNRELRRMRDTRFSDRQLQLAKQQLLGQMAMAVENNSIYMQHQARTLLDYDRVVRFNEFMDEIEKVTPQELIDISNEIFDAEKLCTLIYEEEKD